MILGFSWLKIINPLIFWAQRIIAFLEKPNRKIFLFTVREEKLLHFNAIYFKELMVRLQEKESQVKVIWYKDGRQLSLLSGREEVMPK